MISTFNLLFALKKAKILANGTAPIYLRINIEGDRLEFTTKRYINPSRWNASAQKMAGSHEQARAFNQYLKTLEQQVYDAHRQLIEARQPVTVQYLKDKVLGKSDTAEIKMLVPIFKEHNRRLAAFVGKEVLPLNCLRLITAITLAFNSERWKSLTR